MKTCFKCGQEKPLSDFYKHSQMGDGHLNKCKQCTKSDVARHRQQNLEKVREYDRQRANVPHRKEMRYRIVKEWSENNPDRRRAQSVVRRAVQSGALLPTPCLICGEKAEAHHPDYSSPLDVVWLCRPHHMQAHAIAKQLEAA